MPLAPFDTSIESKLRDLAHRLLSAADAIRELNQLGMFQTMSVLPQNSTAPSTSARPPDFSELSGIEAMRRVLMESGEPLKKDEILARMKARGKAISKGTLEAYLSTEKYLFEGHGG